MRIPRSWMQEFLSAEIPTPDLVELLNMGIAEVEAIETVGGEEVFQVGLKPDRGDCLSILGMAREVAALGDISLVDPSYLRPGADEVTFRAEGNAGTAGDETLSVPIRIEAEDLCHRYVGIVMEGIRVAPSPEWLHRRLVQSGLRPINNVVDATAYVMLEMGQPFHAFDLDRLAGPAIIARRAHPGETITAINGDKYTLTGDQLVIADETNPVAIAGVMGGQGSEVLEGTTRLLLESAAFDPISVKLTSRALGLKTDASQRFERSVDRETTLRGARRLAELIQELAGGRIVGSIADVYLEPAEDRAIRLRPTRVSKVLGMDLDYETIREALIRLGLAVDGDGDELVATIPSRRPDLGIEEDLIEEVARIVGYDEIPMTLPYATSTPGGLISSRQVTEVIREAMAGSGYLEIRSHSMINADLPGRAGETLAAASVRNPTSIDRTILRPSLLPSVLEAAEANVARGFRDQHLFEIGRVFPLEPEADHPGEETHLAGLAMGSAWTSGWNVPEVLARTDFYAVRGAMENLASILRMNFEVREDAGHPSLHPGRSARLLLSTGEELGVLGELHPEIAARFSLTQRPIAFELTLEPLFANYEEAIRHPIGMERLRQPPATRDLAVVVSTEVPYARVAQVIRDAHPLIEDLRLFDRYQGPGLGAEEQSLAFSLVFRHPDRTLTDTDANGAMDEIVAALEAACGARRR